MSRRNMKYLAAVGALFIAASLAGCGTDSKEGGSVTASDVARVDDATCSAAACHDTQRSRVTGVSILDTYRQSNHFIGGRVGCQDCHGGGAEHFGRGPLPFPDPAKDGAKGQCWTCHGSGKYTLVNTAHFNTYTSYTRPAMYMANNNGDCKNCHNPHNPNPTDEHTGWANSGHGNVNAAPFSDEDFGANKDCIRCHTTTGYISYVKHYTLPTAGFATDGDHSPREVIGCNACHYNYDFGNSVRAAGAYTAPYNGGKSPAAFPDADKSNLCIACHSGRESGDSVAAISDFTNASFKNSHYMAAAGLMYAKIGFKNFTSSTAVIGTSSYGKSLTSSLDDVAGYPAGTKGALTSTHRSLGTAALIGDHGVTASQTLLINNGPCVTCHLTGGHDLSGITAGTAKAICNNCHTSEGVHNINLNAGATIDDFNTYFVEEQSVPFKDALAVVSSLLLSKYGIKYDSSAYPYFYDITKDATGKTAVKDWTRGTKDQKFGKKMMGAAFNLNVLNRDPAAYAHARTYARRLIYDTIDFLDDGAINMSVGATVIAYDPVKYVKGALATSPATTEDYKYLAGYNRTSGAWNALERP